MAGGMAHPFLLSTALHMDHMTIAGQVVETKHVFYTWLAMAILTIVGLIVRRNLTLVPGKLQNVLEVAIDGLEDYCVANAGEKIRSVFPFLGVLFLFILVQNLLGLVPTCDAPTANLNTTAAMAIVTFLFYNFVGIKTHGPAYVKHFMGPSPFLAPLMIIIEIVSHLARPLSLTLRLFGNIRGEELAILIFFLMAPIIGTIPIYFLFLLAKCMQAFIFFMLSMIYLKDALSHAH